MPIDHSGNQPSTDEIDPPVGVGLGAGEAEGRLAGHGNGVEMSTTQTAESGVAHFVGITAIEHLIDDLIIVRVIVAGVGLLEV